MPTNTPHSEEHQEYTNVSNFQNKLGEQFTVMYNASLRCGWLTGDEFEEEWICIYDGTIERPLLLAEEESLWLENWWYAADGTRLITIQSLMSLFAVIGYDKAPDVFASLQKAIPNTITQTRPAAGGRPRQMKRSPEEKTVMKAYDAGTKPAEIARELGIEKKQVQTIVNRVTRREARHKTTPS